ncbi:unnamed protein product [Paramecium octaurelia]|uniref:Uncharacterized protein n=1 Tax=Paramecium octaurelia TaxID=43137 RepID=A0A8S1W2J0_PAROT|nr:unnamed protein product [Paramecium octaurelia]
MYNNQSQLKCQHEGHENAIILGVCTFPQCIGKRPFCVGCKFSIHSEHHGSLKKFEEFENWKNENSNNANKLQKLHIKLKELLISIEKVIQNTQDCANSNFTQMDYTTLDNSINNLIIAWKQQDEIIQNLDKFLQSPIAQTALQAIYPQQGRSQSLSQSQQLNAQSFYKIENEVQNNNNSYKISFQTPQQQEIACQNKKFECNRNPIIQGQNKFIPGKPLQADIKLNKEKEGTQFNIKQNEYIHFPSNQQQNRAFLNNDQFRQGSN